MKKKLIIVGLLFVLVLLFYLQYGRDVYVCYTATCGSENSIREEVTLYANKLFIEDKERFAQEMIERYVTNSFNEVYFSRDKGTVEEVKFLVYLNQYKRERYRKEFDIVYYPNNQNECSYIIHQ